MLTKRVDDLQQYVRRPNLRIFGVPVTANESSDDVKRLVEHIMEVNDLEIPNSSIDRAHRIGKVVSSKVDENVKIQPIIVRFTTFRDRTVFYRARKEIKLWNFCRFNGRSSGYFKRVP